MCKGRGHYEEKLTTFVLELDEHILIVKRVPARVCTQCGEKAYSNEVAKRLEQIANTFRDSSTELTIMHYQDRAA